MTLKTTIAALLAVTVAQSAAAQYPWPSKVDLRFDHWYDYEEMTRALHDLAAAYPDLVTLESIGKSVAGLDIWLATVNNAVTGPHTSKTAMFIDGNSQHRCDRRSQSHESPPVSLGPVLSRSVIAVSNCPNFSL